MTMPISLLSRFQGAVLGATLGAAWGSYCQSHLASNGQWHHLWHCPDDWLSGLAVEDEYPQGLDWVSECLLQNDTFSPPTVVALSRSEPTAMVLAIVPLILYYHDDPENLHQQLRSALAQWTNHTALFVSGEVIADACVLALRESLYPPTLIPQLLVLQTQRLTRDGGLEASDRPQPWDCFRQQLTQVQGLWEQAASLMQTCVDLERSNAMPWLTATTLAVYCFLCTPEAFSLAMLRAGRTPQPQLTCSLIGLLSGVYNGLEGLPLHWQVQLSQASHLSPKRGEFSLNANAHWANLHHRVKLATRLFAHWAGIYGSALDDNSVKLSPIVAAADTLRL